MAGAPKLDNVELIARQVEWDAQAEWTMDSGADASLAAAKRYMAAQAFLLSWKEGRVPVGWQRARRLADFDGSYPTRVVDAAHDRINELITERNDAANARIARAAIERRSSAHTQTPRSTLAKKEVAVVSAQLAEFNHAFFDMKAAITKASDAVAELALRTQALQERSTCNTSRRKIVLRAMAFLNAERRDCLRKMKYGAMSGGQRGGSSGSVIRVLRDDALPRHSRLTKGGPGAAKFDGRSRCVRIFPCCWYWYPEL
eukprot:IDg19223t1